MISKNLRLGALFVSVVAVTGCAGTIRNTRLTPTYVETDQQHTKRLLVVTAPHPGGEEKVAELWSLIARRYTNQHRDFLVKEHRAEGSDSLDPKSLCAEGLEGVLWLQPKELVRDGEKVRAALQAKLNRCSDGGEVWATEAGGSWKSADDELKELTAQYVSEIGPEVEPYVAPSFRLLRATLDTLPKPILSEQDIDEKIELGE